MQTNYKISSFSKLFFLFGNLMFVLNVFSPSGILSALYLGSTVLYGVVMIALLAIEKRGNINFNKVNFGNEFVKLFAVVVVFFVISIAEQAVNNDFNTYLITNLIYLLVPMITVFGIAIADAEDYMFYVYVIIIRTTLEFLSTAGQFLTPEYILAISWSDTNSAATESGNAHAFFFITLGLLYLNRKKLAVVTTLLCLLSFKRFSMLAVIAIWVVFWFLPKKEVNKTIVMLAKIAFIVMPLLLALLYSDTGEQWFYQTFNIDLNDFTSHRYSMTVEVMDYFDGNYNGYGTIRNYYETKSSYYAKLHSIHCDWLVIYLECTIIGVAVFANNIIDVVKKNWFIFIMGMYMFVELMISNFLTIHKDWTTLYLFAFIASYVAANPNTKNNLKISNKYIKIKCTR